MMVNLGLQMDEGIKFQSSDVEKFENGKSIIVNEIVLTNKSIIYTYEKKNGLFSKPVHLTERISLSDIRIIDGSVQVSKVNHDYLGTSLQILLNDGSREYFSFSNNRKEIPAWIDALSETITGVKPEPPKKNGLFGFTAHKQNVSSGLSDVMEQINQTFSDVKNQMTSTFNVNTNNAENATNYIYSEFSASSNEAVHPIFCSNCGEKLKADAKFCHNCGAKVEMETVIKEAVAEEKTSEYTERKVVYEGDIHKCPNCGEILNSFTINCPACGHELRNTSNSSSVREFAAKLEQIERLRPQQKFGIKKMLADQREIDETDQKKITHISSFIIPNTKEDLFEFLVLASSNINLQRYNDLETISESQKAVSDAWEAKFEQAYEKAKMSFGDTPGFERFQALYDEKQVQITASRNKQKLFWVGVIGIFAICGIIIFGIFVNDSRKISKENERLDAIVEEVYDALGEENYLLARAKAATLVFSGSTTMEGDKASEKWDKTRTELLDIIDKAEYGPDYVKPEQKENYVPSNIPEDTSENNLEEESKDPITKFAEGLEDGVEAFEGKIEDFENLLNDIDN